MNEETSLAAIGVSFDVDGPATFTISVADPLNPRLELHGADYTVSGEYRTRITELAKEWDDTVTAAYRVDATEDGVQLNQNQVIGLVNTLSDPRDVVVCAAGGRF